MPYLFDDTYTGPRWRYGLTLRPLAQNGNSLVGDWITLSDRRSRDPRFPHGTADWPRELLPEQAKHHGLVLIGTFDRPAYELTRVVHVNDRGGFDVYIGRAVRRRGFEGSKWGNPFPLAMGTREQVIEAFRQHLLASPDLLAALPELRGKRLGCWCKPQACHGDVLAEMADALR